MNKLTLLIKQACRYVDRTIMFNLWKALHSFSGRKMAKRSGDNGLGEWKEQTIADFKVWLSQVENVPDPKDGDPIGECDLYTLLAEFVSLKKQIELQNREQSKNIRGLKDFNEFARQGHAVVALLNERIDQLSIREDKIKEAAQMTAITAFLDVRDTLVRGIHSIKTLGPAFFFSWPKKA